MPTVQNTLLLQALRNSGLFSNHWLENRLPLEPDWPEQRAAAVAAVDELVELWSVQKGRVARYAGEQMLEEQFIQPVLRVLGWGPRMLYQTFLRGRKPDYALFLDPSQVDAALAVGKNHPDFWKHPVVLADAKAWNVSLDRKVVVNSQREYPPEQIEWYLNNSLLDYAILTNGRLWRLIPRMHDPGQGRFQTYLEVDLERLIEDRQKAMSAVLWNGLDDFLRFFLFFSPAGFIDLERRPALVKRARAGSNEYRLGVGEGLKQRVFDALALSIEGFIRHAPNGLAAETDLEFCRQQSLTLLYRLLFVLFAEDRKLLPYRVNRNYTDNRSLGRFRDDIAQHLDQLAAGRGVDYRADQAGFWDDLVSLFDLIDTGASRYGVPAYNGGLFDQEQHPFLRDKVLPDRYLTQVIDKLGRAPDPNRPELGLFRVDYRDLAIQHLGNVYEGLLELRPHCAAGRLVVIRSSSSRHDEEKYIRADEPIPRGFEATGASYGAGDVYLVTDKGERRASGSYYTPDHIVNYIVEATLGPICESVDRALAGEIAAAEGELKRARGASRQEIESRLAVLRADFDDRLLRARVLDPAMGSGHFLIRACQYLAEQIATNPNARDDSHAETSEESTLTYWKRRVAESCLYGVDLNAMAVELAKLALWLETVSINQPLTFLDHHLRHGNSLIGVSVEALSVLPGTEFVSDKFEQQVKQRLPRLIETLALIARTPSDSVERVKEKERLFHRTFEPVRQPFLTAAHVWCAAFFAASADRPTNEQYRAMIDALGDPKGFEELTGAAPFPAAIAASGPAGVAAFHWALEFPEVFFGQAGYRPNRGFDAIIGNPPYDVLSEKETGRDLSALKAFIDQMPIYEPSKNGKNNLYKLFICRALDLLADGGRLGLITPMAVLGDEQALRIRQLVLREGAFMAVEAFPQKDDRAQRVFADAKLSTAVIVISRAADPIVRNRSFTSRVNPAADFDPSAPSLVLSTNLIPLYDPLNLSVVSCDQADWDLATRIMQTGRLTRLGQACVSFQGEVNETNESRRGAISEASTVGPIILRGSNVSLYQLREASQGELLYLDEHAFKRGKSPESKAFHSKEQRVGFQRSSPQNNFRRIVACMISPGHFCFDTVSYVPASSTREPLALVLAILNSNLADWYFRLGSTNSKVNEYQFNNLPCPTFKERSLRPDEQMRVAAVTAVRARRPAEAPAILAAGLASAPFSTAVRDTIIECVNRITAIESARGKIARAQRSALEPQAQPYQDLIDALMYRMAGLSETEARGLEERLARML